MGILSNAELKETFAYNLKVLQMFDRLDTVLSYIIFLTHLGQLLLTMFPTNVGVDINKVGAQRVGYNSGSDVLHNLVKLRNSLAHYNRVTFRDAVEVLKGADFAREEHIAEFATLLNSIDWDELSSFYLNVDETVEDCYLAYFKK